jgi:hypothetical protein
LLRHLDLGSRRRFTVKYNEDDTDQLLCSVEFSLLIASEFDWQLLSQSVVQTPENAEPVNVAIAITLSERDFTDTRFAYRPKPALLERAAFRHKQYQLRLEKGSFKVEGRTTFGYNPTYEYRLLWDESPYPPLEEWKKKGAARANRFWERKDFYKGELGE